MYTSDNSPDRPQRRRYRGEKVRIVIPKRFAAPLLAAAAVIVGANAAAIPFFADHVGSDPHRYQRIIYSCLVFSVVSLAISIWFTQVARGRMRLAVLAPLALLALACYGMAALWPIAFR